jgi:CHASE2 domain-containing sensor protein
LENAELQGFDQMMQWRPQEGADPRLLVVTIDDNDIAAQRQRQESLVKEGKTVSLSDRSLNRLLTLLETYKPTVIGLDLYRDLQPDRNQPDLLPRLQRQQNLVGICKVNFTRLDPGIKPPTGVARDRVGFSDFVDDADGVVRRQLLFMNPPQSSRCQAQYAFSFHLAYRYLQAQGIQPRFTPDGNLQLGQQVFHRLQSRTGGYQNLDARGGQVLLNYRATPTIAEQVSLTTLLSGELDPRVLQEAIRDRIVLIGVTARDSEDRWLTPFGKEPDNQMPGVFVQAHMVSQVLSAVLDQRPLLWVWSPWQEVIWLGGWSLLGGLLAWRFSQPNDRRSLLRYISAMGLATSCLLGVSFYLLIRGGWTPLVPATLGLLLAGGSVTAGLHTQSTRSLPTRLDPSFRS